MGPREVATGDFSESESPHFPKFSQQSMTDSTALVFFGMGTGG